MRKATPKVSEYPGSKTSKYVVEGLRIGGKRVRRFFPTRREASVFLRHTLAQLRKEGEAGLSMSPELRAEAARTAEKLLPYGKTLTDAVTFYLRHLESVHRTATVAELVEKYIASKAALGRSPLHLADLKTRLRRFSGALGSFNMATVTIQDVEGWLDGIQLSPQSVNHHRDKVSSLFEYAVARGYATENPVAKIEKRKVLRTPPSVLAPDQLRSLLNAAPADLQPFLAIGAFAGLRSSEIFVLDWRSVDLTRRIIIIDADKTKTARRRIVKVQDCLAAWLAPLARKEGKVLPFEDSKLYLELHKLLPGASLKLWPDNCLRHSYCSYHLAKWQNANETAEQSGHDVKVLRAHYRELVLPGEADKYWQIIPQSACCNVVAFTPGFANA
jgi:integrase